MLLYLCLYAVRQHWTIFWHWSGLCARSLFYFTLFFLMSKCDDAWEMTVQGVGSVHMYSHQSPTVRSNWNIHHRDEATLPVDSSLLWGATLPFTDTCPHEEHTQQKREGWMERDRETERVRERQLIKTLLIECQTVSLISNPIISRLMPQLF